MILEPILFSEKELTSLHNVFSHKCIVGAIDKVFKAKRNRRVRSDELDKIWDICGYTIKHPVALLNCPESVKRVVMNYGSIELNRDFKNMKEFREWINENYMYKRRKIIFSDIRTYAIEKWYSKSDKIILGPEIETVTHYIIQENLRFIGKFSECFFLNYDLEPKLYEDIIYGNRELEGTCLYNFYRLIEEIEDIGQRKLISVFYWIAVNVDVIIYIGAYPGLGWMTCLERFIRRPKFVVAVDPKFKSDFKRVSNGDTDHYVKFDNNEIFYPQDLQQYFDVLKSTYGDKKYGFIWDVRRDFPPDMNEFIYNVEVRKEMSLGVDIVSEFDFAFYSLKIRVDSIVDGMRFPLGNFFLQPHYRHDGSEVRLVGQNKLLKCMTDVDLIKLQTLLRKGKFLSNELKFLYYSFSRIEREDFFNCELYGEKIVAICCLNSERDNNVKINKMLKYNKVFSLVQLGVGGVRDLDEYGEEILYNPYDIMSNLTLGYRMLMPYIFSDYKYVRCLNKWRVLSNGLNPEIYEEPFALKADLYIGALKEYFNSLMVNFDTLYDDVRRRCALSKNKYLLKDVIDNERIPRDIDNIISPSGHLCRIIILSSFIPIDVFYYILYTLTNFYKHVLPSHMSKYKEIRLIKPAMIAYEERKQLWHSVVEWICGAESAFEILREFSINSPLDESLFIQQLNELYVTTAKSQYGSEVLEFFKHPIHRPLIKKVSIKRDSNGNFSITNKIESNKNAFADTHKNYNDINPAEDIQQRHLKAETAEDIQQRNVNENMNVEDINYNVN